METIIAAVIGGLATLASVFLHHHLALKREVLHYRSQLGVSHNYQLLAYEASNNSNRKKTNDILVGMVLIVLDIVVVIISVTAFDLLNTEPAWENVFALIVLGVIPTYATYRIVKGIAHKVKQVCT
ncbi:membrane hypothetical protein [Vibrio chagasii]|nr:membrane hypothetical protein [Vibrio chagasii]CAH7237644.1 membrane hypothetical protein [Vibrio chagasii]CAH7269398.1 membrane hypothetical protein [Vibrio chagasii]